MNVKNLKEEIIAAGISYGAVSVARSPAVVELMGLVVGYRFVWIEIEHGSAVWPDVEDQCRAAELRGLWPMLRVASGQRENVLRGLEAGGKIIVTPMINTAEDARKVAEYGKFPPLGLRGFNLGSRGMDYTVGGSIEERLAAANAGTVLLCQIETIEAVQNAEAIIATPGIDGILIGPGDLSASMGIPGRWDSPELMDRCVNVFAIAKEHKKITATVCPTLDMTRRWKEIGVNLLCIGSDVGLLRDAFRQCLKTMREL
ncbi:MAG: aldolase/citrate lyase family protein [Planctomycetota bacterium]